MIEPLPLATHLAAGIALGVFYFGGLWLTVRRIPTSPSPARLLIMSWVIRVAVILGGLYWAVKHGVFNLSALLLGFLAARWIVLRWVRRSRPNGDPGPSERPEMELTP